MLTRRVLTWGVGSAMALLFGSMSTIAAQDPENQDALESSALADIEQHWSLLENYCIQCHNFTDWAGELALDILSPADIPEDAEIWEAVMRKLRGRLMPPPGESQPDQVDIDALVAWLGSTLDGAAASGVHAGYVPAHRLNRTEYAAAVYGLLGVVIDPAEFLPTEITVEGFDNIASVLTVSPAFLEQYIAAAQHVARLAVGDPVLRAASTFYPAPGGNQDVYIPGMPLGSRGGIAFTHYFSGDGEYRFSFRNFDSGSGYPRGIESQHTMVILVGGEVVHVTEVGTPQDLALVDRYGPGQGHAMFMERFTNIPIQVTAGEHQVIVTFIERAQGVSHELIGTGAFANLTRAPRITDGFEIVGPFAADGMARAAHRQQLLFICEPQSVDEEYACAELIAENLARRAFRRPVEQDEVHRLMDFYAAGYEEWGNFDAGVEYVVTAVLASPDFLYRTVLPPSDANQASGQTLVANAQAYPLSDLELASRLSFFLWRQGPDDPLLELAIAGELSDPAVLDAQVLRMLADSRASGLVTDFSFKWLGLTDLTAVTPDPRRFPGFNLQLRQDFAAELELFIGSILLEDRNVLDLLTADHTYVNQRLAQHYGISGVVGTQFRRVTLPDEVRWGLLGKGAVLLRTSYGDRTSPVLRGAWVLEKLMGTPPAPPPPEVETDLTIREGETPRTQREQLALHREDASCNACHGVIDPIGFALENFDVTGVWRTFDTLAQENIDASTVLPNGVFVNGPVELREELVRQPEMFVQTLTEKLLMFALGRELEYYDMPQVRAIVRAAAQEDYRFSAIVLGVINSHAFRMQSLPPGADFDGTQANTTTIAQ